MIYNTRPGHCHEIKRSFTYLFTYNYNVILGSPTVSVLAGKKKSDMFLFIRSICDIFIRQQVDFATVLVPGGGVEGVG